MDACALFIDAIDGASKCVTLMWQGKTGLSDELSLPAEYGLVPLDPVRAFDNLKRKNIAHKLLNETSWRESITKQLYGDEDDCVSHFFYVNRFYNIRTDDHGKCIKKRKRKFC